MHSKTEDRAKGSPGPAASSGDASPARAHDRLARLRALLIFAVLLPLGLMAGEAALVWNRAWSEAEKELSRTADAAAEYSLRAFETHRIALAQVNQVLGGLSDDNIRTRERDLHEQLKRLVPEIPLIQTIAVNDRHGGVLLTANVYPVPRDVTVVDREWWRDLSADRAPRTHVSRVYVGKLDQFLFFSVSRRRTGSGNGLPDGTFDGVVNVSVQPNEFAAGFNHLTDVPDDAIALIRADGQILARRPAFKAPLAPITQPAAFFSAVAGGRDRGTYRGVRLVEDGMERLVAYRKVQGYPVYAVAAREVDVVVASWVNSVARLGAIGIPAVCVLGVLALFAYRRSRDAQAMQASLIEMTARRAAADAARAAEARFHAIFQYSPSGVLAVDRDGRIRLTNPMLEQQFGYASGELIGEPVERLVPERFRTGHPALRARFAADPTPRRMGAGRDLYGLRKDGSEFPVEIGLSSLATEDGEYALAIIIDITERRLAERREKLLAGELQHRTKNLFAVVHALAQRSLRGEQTLDEAREAFAGRIEALARAEQRLTNSAWKGTSLNEVVAAELEPFVGRVKIEGAELMLSPQAAQNFALALHELATNAAKYGALSVPGGTVSVAWAMGGDAHRGELRFRWQERGGPSVAPPARSGFGTALLKATLGAGHIEYAAQGLSYEVDLPLAEIAAGAKEDSADRA